MLSDVRRAEEARVVEEHFLHKLSDVDADARLAFVRFEDRENLSATHAKRGMAEADRFFYVGQSETDFAQLLWNFRLGRHP
jgi:hypothetical protein